MQNNPQRTTRNNSELNESIMLPAAKQVTSIGNRLYCLSSKPRFVPDLVRDCSNSASFDAAKLQPK
jgi:hypothetical protein